MNYWRIVDPELFTNLSLTTHNHHTFHLAAALLAIIAAWAYLPVVERFNSSQQHHRKAWLMAGSIAMGTGIWAMHFTAMLAFHIEGISIEYDPLITALSILPAAIGSAICILLAKKARRSILHMHISALSMAVGIGIMHYLGMEAMVASGADMYYKPVYFFLSIVAAYVLALVGLHSYNRLGYVSFFHQKHSRLISSIILGLSVSAMHFVAMKATYFQPQTGHIVKHVFDEHIPLNIATAVFIATILLISAVIFISKIDKKLSSVSKSLNESEEKFQRLANTTQAAIFSIENSMIKYANPALELITGYKNSSLLSMPINLTFGSAFDSFIKDITQSTETINTPQDALFEIATASGEMRWLYFNVIAIQRQKTVEALGSAFDITEQKQAELHLHQLAYTDQLTELANRAKFIKQLNNHIELIQAGSVKNTYVMLVDLDNFKSVNDTNGHVYGDRLLAEVASRLLFISKSADLVARLGGDEFVLLINTSDQSRQLSDVANEVIDSLSKPYRLSQRVININCSIGTLELDSNYTRADQVLHDVDIALYRAKQELTSAWVKFDAEQDAQTKRDRMLYPELRAAIQQEQIDFYYQPIVNATDHQIAGFETLARWQRDNNEFVSPVEFIPLAEKTGLIADIGLLGIKQACKQIAQWQSDKLVNDHFYVSVNVSAISMTDDRFFHAVKALFSQYNIQAGQIKLELTESILVEDFQMITPKLNELIEMGCEIMIDDFGTGYSSLSYLNQLPVSTLKIDRSFVLKLTEDPASESLVNTIIALAKTLNLKVVTEGIETLEQAKRLQALGSSHLQGYYFSKPMPANEVENYLLNMAS